MASPVLAFERGLVAGDAPAALERADYVDALPGLVPHFRPLMIPRGAPLVLRGWCAPDGEEPAEVVAVVDEAHVHAVAASVDRPDVALTDRRVRGRRIGFRFVLDTREMLPAAHEARIYARAAGGPWRHGVHVPFHVFDPVVRGRSDEDVRLGIEETREYDDLSGALAGRDVPVPLGRIAVIRGWAIGARTARAAQAVRATDARGRSWSASGGLLLPRLRSRVVVPDGAVGFEIVIPSAQLGRGRHVLAIRALDEQGRWYRGECFVVLDVAGPLRPFPPFAVPAAALGNVSARWGSFVTAPGEDGSIAAERTRWTIAHARSELDLGRDETLRVEGWAFDLVRGEGAERVFLEAVHRDEILSPYRLAAVSGYRRDDPPADLGRPPSPDGWFHVRWEAAHLPRGEYDLALLTLGHRARRYGRVPIGRLRVSERTR